MVQVDLDDYEQLDDIIDDYYTKLVAASPDWVAAEYTRAMCKEDFTMGSVLLLYGVIGALTGDKDPRPFNKPTRIGRKHTRTQHGREAAGLMGDRGSFFRDARNAAGDAGAPALAALRDLGPAGGPVHGEARLPWLHPGGVH